MMLVGLTGGIASGKNTVANFFKARGCYTIDADDVSREIMKPGGEAYESIIEAFGKEILAPDGQIERAALRAKVVDDKEKKGVLEKIIHPLVSKNSERSYKKIKGQDDKAIVIYHAPLLIESGYTKRFDAIVLIWCSEEEQLRRLEKRGYPPYEDGVKLMKTQMSYEEKLRYASHIINNNETFEALEAEVERVLNLLKIFQYTSNINKRSK